MNPLGDDEKKFQEYFNHLSSVNWRGRLYKRFFSSPLLYFYARRFGSRIIEVGCGTGNGVLGAFPAHVCGVDINPLAIDVCRDIGLNAHLISESEPFPFANGSFDVCILDNVLEHIPDPRQILDECYRATSSKGGMIVAVPGLRGFKFDEDHKYYYTEDLLRSLDERWVLCKLFAMPSFFLSSFLSTKMRQYCIVAVYKKGDSV